MIKINLYSIQLDKKIGDSQNGCVYPYYEDLDITGWVMKCMHVKDSNEVNQILQDIMHNSIYRYPCVLPIEGYNVHKDDFDGWRVFIKMPKMSKNLKDIKDEYGRRKKILMPFAEVVTYFYYLASLLEYLERKKIAHRNLKPSNILLDNEGRIYLSDMSTERFKKEGSNIGGLSNARDSMLYMAPEIFYESFFNKEEDPIKADAWSLGMIILDLCLKDLKPMPLLMAKQEKEKVIQNYLQALKQNYPVGGKDLGLILRNLLKIDVSERRTACFARKALERKFSILSRVRETVSYHPVQMLSSDEYDVSVNDVEDQDDYERSPDNEDEDIDVAIGNQHILVARVIKAWKNINFDKWEKITNTNKFRVLMIIIFALLGFLIAFQTEAEKVNARYSDSQNIYDLSSKSA